MRACGSAALVSILVVLTTTAEAAGPRTQRGIVADALTAMPAAGIAKPLRAQRDVKWSHPPTAGWQKLAGTGTWQAAWDRATGVPSRIWGSGIAAPGTIASPTAAAAFARAALADHIALLAPGASPADFELVSNHFDGDIRSVGFVQKHDGRVVVGGQVSFRFKRDRLFVIGSEALPGVALPPPIQGTARARMSRAALRDRATQALRSELALPGAPVSAPGAEVVLPLVGDDAVLGYRVAVPVTIDGGADGKYLAYCDAATGETLAVRQLNMYSTGTLMVRSVDRYPGPPRIDLPAPRAHVMLDGAAQTTTGTGELSWSDTASHTVTTSVIGDLVNVVNKADGGAAATTQLALAPDGQAVWDPAAVVEDDAQVQTYLSVNIAKEFARSIDPNMRTLDEQITANVNLAQNCNAFFDGRTINFFHASADCQNTGLLQDVVYHEYGHAVHAAEIIDGVGAFDTAMSEGAADFFAAQITGDPRMGVGFFYTDKPLRNIDPEDKENRWPQDIGEVHKTGLIFGGAFWDLRKDLIETLGEDEAIPLVKKIFAGALRRSVGIPSSLIEALAADDTDGNLANGTPHECNIRNAYGRHGLRTATGTVEAPAKLAQPTRETTVHIDIDGLAQRCSGDELDHLELDWKLANDTGILGQAMAIPSDDDPSKFYAQLPLATDGKMLYQVKIVFKDQSVMTLPDNLADPFYEVYQARTVALYCADFETGDPMSEGWVAGTGDGDLPQWAWGVPGSGATDPHAAFSNSHVLAQVLNGDYPAKSYAYIKMPPIDVGAWTDVHLQYRRWLAVEDSHYDQARVTVGGRQAWVNFTQNIGDSSSAQHVDREWRFQDVPVSGYQPGHILEIAWDLKSDEGLQFGGWTIDDVCVVANTNSVCGDGKVTAKEACDDGVDNADRPDACRTWCQPPACGDGIVDQHEDCDGGLDGSATCTPDCALIEPPGLGGCCSAQRDAGASGALGALVLGLILRRRRRALGYC
jgi:MYXO-CTERM domain-containing protein